MASTPIVFDRAAVRRNLRRAQKLGAATFLIDRAAEDLCDRLCAVLRRFELAVDLASPSDAVRRRMRGADMVSTLIAVTDAVPADRSARGDDLRIVADAEALPLGENALDLVVSALALQFVNDLPGTFAQICRALTPDGLFLAALIGGDSLTELRQAFAAAESELERGASPRVAPFADVRAVGMLLQRAGFALPVADLETLTVTYPDMQGLLADLRAQVAKACRWGDGAGGADKIGEPGQLRPSRADQTACDGSGRARRDRRRHRRICRHLRLHEAL